MKTYYCSRYWEISNPFSHISLTIQDWFILTQSLMVNAALTIQDWVTVSAPFEPHSWIEPHPPRNHAKMQFLCVFYVTIWGQKLVLKNRTPGFIWSRYGIWFGLCIRDVICIIKHIMYVYCDTISPTLNSTTVTIFLWAKDFGCFGFKKLVLTIW